jgi:hypothetical protein
MGEYIEMDLQEEGCGGTDWFDLTEDRERWRAVFVRKRNFGFHEMGNSLIS